jgi:hypothetical protein
VLNMRTGVCQSRVGRSEEVKIYWSCGEANLGLLANNRLTLSRGDQENDVRLLDGEQEGP